MSKRDAGAWRTDDRFAFSSFSKMRSMGHGGSNPLIFVLSTALLVLFILGYVAYFFTFAAPFLMLLIAFRMPIFVGLVLPAALVGALYLILSGSLFIGLGVMAVAFVATVVLGVMSSNVVTQNANTNVQYQPSI